MSILFNGRNRFRFRQRGFNVYLVSLLAFIMPEPCTHCGWRLRSSDCATIEDGITHCICYNCGAEWVE